jgi:hypothetical protein
MCYSILLGWKHWDWRQVCRTPETGLRKLKWYIDNKGVIENFWRMPNYVANDWSKMGDRDVFGYINRMQDVVAGVWNVKHRSERAC